MRRQGNAGVVGEVLAVPDRQDEARLQVEERDRAVLELRPEDAFGLEAKAVAVEAE